MAYHLSSKSLLFAVLASAIALPSAPARAQLIPDDSLGTDRSVVESNPVEPQTFWIQGGSEQGINLFHSFQDFNVTAGQRVYFANPTGVEQIFSRITGNSASNIDGLLGVAGAADLFLLNPQGILFGPGAKLEISGSFLATTATDFIFGDAQQQFGISNPSQVPLLTSRIQPGLQFGRTAGSPGDDLPGSNLPGGNISTNSTLAVGQDLQLEAQTLDLKGQLRAGGDVTLRGREQVQINDSTAQPFIASAGEQLLVQGDRALSISALSHPQSQLAAGGDLILRSGSSINGDAQFRSGGNFQIQQLDQSPGPFQSPDDPVIRAGGDVSFTDYRGSSLHVLAGGQVTADNITILSAAVGAVAEDFLRETVALSDGSTVAIDGGARPTLDIRAGVSADAIGNALGNTGDSSGFGSAPLDNGTPTSANITLGQVNFEAPNGQILLTNQYQANGALTGDIALSVLRGNDGRGGRFTGNGADLTVDAKQNFRVTDRVDTSSSTGESGSMQLLAQGNIELDQSYLTSNNNGPFTPGNITIKTGNFSALNGSQIQINTAGFGDAGATQITATGDVTFDGLLPLGAQPVPEFNTKGDRAGIDNRILSNGQANSPGVSSGGIAISARNINVTDGAQFQVRVDDNARGTSGNIQLQATDTIAVNGVSSEATSPRGASSSGLITSIEGGAEGTAGNIILEARRVEVLDGGSLQSNTIGRGNSGSISITARESLEASGVGRQRPSFIQSKVNQSGVGNGGDINVNASQIAILNGAFLEASTDGRGNAGNVMITAGESLRLGGSGNSNQPESLRDSFIRSQVNDTAIGDGGNVTIFAPRLEMFDGGEIKTNSTPGKTATGFDPGRGNAGSIIITAPESVTLRNGAQLFSDVDDNGSFAGNIIITTGRFEMKYDTEIFAGTDSRDPNSPGGGAIRINATESFLLSDFSEIKTLQGDDSFGGAGDIEITSPTIKVDDASNIISFSEGTGDGGNITLNAERGLTVRNGSQINANILRKGTGTAGSILLNAGEIFIEKNTNITSLSEGNGDGGSITLEADRDILIQNNSRITADIRETGEGKAGNILLAAEEITLMGEAIGRDVKIESRNRSRRQGQGGNITLQAARVNIPFFVTIVSSIEGNAKGKAGNILIDTEEFTMNAASLQANVIGEGEGGNVTIKGSKFVTITDSPNAILTRVNNSGIGPGGNAVIETPNLKILDGSRIISSTEGQGPAGNIQLLVSETVLIEGITQPDSRLFIFCPDNVCQSSLLSRVESSAQGIESRSGNIEITAGTLRISEQGRIDVSSNNLGEAGNVNITTGDLDIRSSGQIRSSATAEGQGGDILIEARESITVADTNSSIAAQTEAVGDAGSITLVTPQLSVQNQGEVATASINGAVGNAGGITINSGDSNLLNINLQGGTITAETQGSGDGGDLVLNSSEAVTIGGNGILTAQTSDTGSAGNVRVTTNRLTIDQGTTLSTTATATANPPANEDGTKANIELTANEMNLFGTVQVLSETQGNAQAGRLTLRPNSSPDLAINLRDSSRVSASTSGSGEGGQLSIIAPRTLTISGQGSLSAETLGNGPAGSVRVEAQDFTLQNGAQLSTSTIGEGSGGNISITAPNSVTIRNQAQVVAETRGSGDAGSVAIRTQQFTLGSGAELSTSTSGSGSGGNIMLDAPDRILLQDQAQLIAQSTERASGQAGNIELRTGELKLDNQAGITVRSGNTGDGGNITIDASRPILLDGRSVIETDAGGSGDGGNISIKTPYLIGFSNANADIIANAVSGNGGRVTIEAQRLLNFQIKDGQNRTRLRNNQSNDISASSETGTSGTVALDTLNVDPSRGLAELPVDLTDPGDRISQGCRASSDVNSFVNSGRGGIPQGPDAPLRSSTTASQWITPSSEVLSQRGETIASTASASQSVKAEGIAQIAEVQGWQRDGHGRMRLVVDRGAVSQDGSTDSAPQVALNCKAEPIMQTTVPAESG